MTQQLWIPGPLPGLNEIIEACKGAGGTGRAYARMKRAWTETVAILAKAAKLKPIGSADFKFEWRAKDRSRNKDNMAAARKFVFDGLVVAGVLVNDGWKEIGSWADTFDVSPRPGVLVHIYPRGVVAETPVQ